MWESLGSVYRNRWLLSNTDKANNGFTTKGFKPLIYQSSGPQWNVAGSDQAKESHWTPEGLLKPKEFSSLTNILNGSDSAPICNGLIASFPDRDASI